MTLAETNKMYVTVRVTVNLSFLICGYNADPKKIEHAINSFGDVGIMDEEEFLHFLKTGKVQSN